MTKTKLERIWQIILLALVLAGADAYACEPGEASFGHDHSVVSQGISQRLVSTQTADNHSLQANPRQVSTFDRDEHSGESLGHQKCKCCDSCKCAVCSGCLGGCAAMAIPTVLSGFTDAVVALEKPESRQNLYMSPPLPLLEYPPRRPVTGISA